MADTKQTITCPACDKEMAKIYIKDANVNIDVCLDGCGGIFFDNRELEKFDEEHENADKILEAINGKNFETVEEKEVRICPICNVSMVKQGSGAEGIEIDVCNVCGSKFLDNGELIKIREMINDKEFQDKVNSEVDNYINENKYIPGGKIAQMWTKFYPNLGLRDASERFVRLFIQNL